MELAKLNKKELKHAKDLSMCPDGKIFDEVMAKYGEKEFGNHIDEIPMYFNEKEYNEWIEEFRLYKTFFRELKKLERKHGYEPIEANIINMYSYFGYEFEFIEEWVYCFKDNLKEGAKRYFEEHY